MKKLLFVLLTPFIMFGFVGVSSCGPSAAEKARMDSIRVADSLRVADSIMIADSLKAVREQEALREAYHKRVDEVAAATKADFVLKMYELNKVVYANAGNIGEKKTIKIYDVVAEKEEKMVLRGSENSGWIDEITQGKEQNQIVVKIHLGGMVSFYSNYIVDGVEKKLIRVEDAS